MNLNTAIAALGNKHNIPPKSNVPPVKPTVVSYSGVELQKILPKQFKGKLDQEVLDRIETILNDPLMQENYSETLLSHVNVLCKGRFTLHQYVNACKFVSHKLLGFSDIDAYVQTFPDKYAGFVSAGKDGKEISCYCSAYSNSKLVTLITEQTMTPVWVANNYLFQEAINKEANLMRTAKSEFVQHEAAKTLLTVLRPPEKQEIELSVGVRKDSMINSLREAASKLATEQLKSIKRGQQSIKQLADSTLVIDIGEAEYDG